MGDFMEIIPLKSGSRGNAALVFSGKTKILVDCGVSGKCAETTLKNIGINPTELSAIVVTHEHTDHIHGVGIMMRRYKLPVWANQGTWDAMYNNLGKLDDSLIKVFDTKSSFEIGEIGINPFSIPHDAAEPVGYSFSHNGKKVSVATDIGELSPMLFDSLKESNTVLLEANHDVNMLEVGSYPLNLKRRIRSNLGHLSNDEAGIAARILVKTGTERIILGHLSEENNYPKLAEQTVICSLNNDGIKCGTDVNLSVAAS